MPLTIARSPESVTTNRRALTAEWNAMLRYGDRDGKYPTSYQAVMGLAVVAVRAGWSLYDWTTAMSDPHNDLAAHYRRKDDGRRRTHANAEGRMIRDWAKATRYAADNPQISDPGEIMQHLGLVRAAVAGAEWGGRAGLRDRVILGVILDAAESRPTACPTISLRSLCEQTPYRARATVQRGLDSLSSAGWLIKDRSRSATTAPTAYRIVLPGGVHSGSAPTPPVGAQPADPQWTPPVEREGPVGRINHDLGIRFGMQAALIYSTLDPDIPQTMPAVVRRSGVSRSTVKRWLPELALMGLCYRTPQGWYQGLRDAELVALENGALDLTEARKMRHELQRQGFAEWHERRSADTR